MITLPYKCYSTKIQDYFSQQVFVIGTGPDYFKWLHETYGANLVQISFNRWELEFNNEKDAAMFMLRWQ